MVSADSRPEAEKPVVLFGAGPFAALAWYCLTHEGRQVVGFTGDAAYVGEGEHCGLPVQAFEELEARFPPDQVEVLLLVGFVSCFWLWWES